MAHTVADQNPAHAAWQLALSTGCKLPKNCSRPAVSSVCSDVARQNRENPRFALAGMVAATLAKMALRPGKRFLQLPGPGLRGVPPAAFTTAPALCPTRKPRTCSSSSGPVVTPCRPCPTRHAGHRQLSSSGYHRDFQILKSFEPMTQFSTSSTSCCPASAAHQTRPAEPSPNTTLCSRWRITSLWS
jgi:hypothetical protein